MAKTLDYDFTAPQFNGTTGIEAQTGPDLTVTRASDATVMDYFNVLKTVNDNEPRFTGGRRVENLLKQSNSFDTTWVNIQSVYAQGATDPDGGSTAWTITDDSATGTGDAYMRQSAVPIPDSGDIIYSIYAKKDQLDWLFLQGVGGVIVPDCYFDLTNGVVGTADALIDASGIEDAGNGWYRCWMAFSVDTESTSTLGFFAYVAEADNDKTIDRDGTSSIQIYGAQVEDVTGQDDPSPSEYIATTTAAKAQWYATKRRTNLALESEDFDAAVWNGGNTTYTTGQSDPFSGTSASDVKHNDTNEQHYQAYTFPVNQGTYTASCYFKQGLTGTHDWATIRISGTGGLPYRDFWFDISSGAIGTNTGTAGNPSLGHSIEDVGSGWYRCVCSMSIDTEDTTVSIGISNTTADGNATEEDTNSLLWYGAQLEVGSTATAYIATTTTVASSSFDTAITPTGLLIEEARTNVQVWTESFDNAAWVKVNGNEAVDINATTAPDGTVTADRLIDDIGGGTGAVTLQPPGRTVTSGVAETYSIYAKADQLSWLRIESRAFDAGANGSTWFDLATPAVGTESANHTTTVEDVGNGWTRCSITFTSVTDLSGSFRFYCCPADGVTNVDLDGTSSIFLWGAQLEAGSFPTSYIPNDSATASVTRNLDLVNTASYTGWSNTANSIYLKAIPGGSQINKYPLELSDNGASNRTLFHTNGGTFSTLHFYSSDGVTNWYPSKSSALTVGTSFQTAVGIAANDGQWYLDGVDCGSTASVGVSQGVDNVDIGAKYNSSANWTGHIARVSVWDERLTDAQLEDLSNGTFPVAESNQITFVRNVVRNLVTAAVRNVSYTA